MKKITKLATLLLCVIMIISSLTACSIFRNQSDDSGSSGGEGSTQSTLTLYNGESSIQYVAKYGEKATITVNSKKGYYLEGYFDAQEGGTKYFDSLGKSLLKWEKSFPTILYARWSDISNLNQEISVFGNEPESGGVSGQRTTQLKLSDEFVSALKGNFDGKLKIEYSIDLKTASGYDTASPIGMYIKGYESSGAERYTVFTHTPIIGEFSTFTGKVEIKAADFIDGNIYLVVWNTKKFMNAWAYPVFYSRNLILKISIVTE